MTNVEIKEKLRIKEKLDSHLLRTISWSSAVLSILLIVYNLVYFNKTLPNTHFAKIDVSGKDKEQISSVVRNYLKSFEEEKIKISAGRHSLTFKPEELGIEYDVDRSIDEVISTYTSTSLRHYLDKKLASLFKVRFVEPVYKIDFSKLNSTLERNLERLEKKATSSTIVFDEKGPKILSEEKGVVVDRAKLVKDLIKTLDNLSTNEEITASYIEDAPKVNEENAQLALKKVKQLDEQQITLTYEFDKWRLGGENLLSILAFYPRDDIDSIAQLNWGDKPILIKDVYYEGKRGHTLEVKLDGESLDSFIEEIATAIDKPKIDATLEFDGVRVSKFTPAQDGRGLNKNKVRDAILDVVSIGDLVVSQNRLIELPVEVTKAKIANEEINSLGIRELIASGVSYFVGSIPNRAFNIGLGSQLINGTVVPPGETFSFNKLVGPVSAEQGFKEAYVISRGRTVLDDGGGICQVSTTVFRAALNAGLPIVERTAHAYRVSYYEQRGFEPGFDATIWSPTVDLKFRNDTQHHILVQAKVDSAQAKLQIDIYGTRDDRRVEIVDPVLTSHKPAPEPKYENDPTLPAGAVKQVDFAADGLTSVLKRRVYKGDKLAIDDTFKSVFRPWQAVYLVGTGG